MYPLSLPHRAYFGPNNVQYVLYSFSSACDKPGAAERALRVWGVGISKGGGAEGGSAEGEQLFWPQGSVTLR